MYICIGIVQRYIKTWRDVCAILEKAFGISQIFYSYFRIAPVFLNGIFLLPKFELSGV
jgi:hypothetical protein